MIQRTKGFLCAALAAAALVVTPTTAAAQSEGRFAIGAHVSFHFPTSDELDRSIGFGVNYRVSRPSRHDGWSPDFGFGWLGADLTSGLDGHLNVRPIMGGVSYHWVRGKFRYHIGAITGPAFVKVAVNDDERATYTATFGQRVVGVDAKRHSWAERTQVKVTYDLKPRLGLFVSADYEIARPELEIKTLTTTINHKLKADTFSVKLGFLVGLF